MALTDTPGLSDAQARRVQRAAEVALRELSGFSLKEGAASRRGVPKRGCRDDARCLVAQMQAAGADHGLLLGLKASGGRLSVDAFFVSVSAQKASHRQINDGSLEEPEVAVKSLVEAILPAFGRKGWGGLAVDAPPGSTVKVDGRRVAVTPMEEMALTSSQHAVDVLFPGGQAMLQRLHVPEGSRVRLAVAPVAVGDVVAGGASSGAEGLRTLSYALWGAGAVAVAGSLLAGAASRQAASPLTPCQGADRTCLSVEEARQQHETAQAYARTGNILLGTGAALSAAGAGLFTFDLVQSQKKP